VKKNVENLRGDGATWRKLRVLTLCTGKGAALDSAKENLEARHV
jgi:hypothetical protein